MLDNDREQLRKFLNYVDDTNELADEENYFRIKLADYVKGTDRLYLIAYESKIVGAIDLHFIGAANHYCVQKLYQIGFETMALNRITLVADTEKKQSSCGKMRIYVGRYTETKQNETGLFPPRFFIQYEGFLSFPRRTSKTVAASPARSPYRGCDYL